MNDFTAAGLADIHNHLVPGVDDGAQTLDESLRNLRRLAGEGVTRLAVSPHLRGWRTAEPGMLDDRLHALERAYERLERACAERDDVPALQFSQEILVSDADTARTLFADPRVGVSGTDYATIEFGFELEGDPLEVIDAAKRAGRRPIVVHPERFLREGRRVRMEEIRGWSAAGARLQVNGGSLLGSYGEEVERLGWRLVRAGLADLVATDHHGDHWPVSPAEVGRAIAARGAADRARLLLSENPHRVLDNRPTVAVAPFAARAAA